MEKEIISRKKIAVKKKCQQRDGDKRDPGKKEEKSRDIFKGKC